MKLHRFSIGLVPFLLNVLRALGCYPYIWKSNNFGNVEVRRSLSATLWSLALMAVMTGLSVTSIIYSPRNIKGMTARVSAYILNYGTYGLLSVFFPYIVLRSHRLAGILRILAGNGVSIRGSIVTKRDYFIFIYIAGTSSSLIYLTYDAFKRLGKLQIRDHIIYLSVGGTCDLVFELMVVAVILLVYFLLKIVYLECKDTIGNMCLNFERISSSPLKEIEERRKNNYGNLIQVMPYDQSLIIEDLVTSLTKHVLSTRIDTRTKTAQQKRLTTSSGDEPTRRTSNTSSCHNQVANYLMSLDEAVLEITDYAGPLVIMILLTSTVNATTMLYLTSKGLNLYYCAYISLKILCVVEITRLADPLWWKKEECLRELNRISTMRRYSETKKACLQKVEKALMASPSFDVCRLFVLDRHVLITVGHAVITYLIICLQFGSLETPDNPERNSTAEKHC
ncbi:uncharacterized protein LOC135202710 [Macrobrachium nipponense]|uniref:uncharacterized protein LOC135202710 n=1 Tax=Macrobrachium nipponense TaxID=159736 RepID=UPI0030C89CC0